MTEKIIDNHKNGMPVMLALIAAYCAASVLWSRIFLREKLSWRHYLMLLLIVVGIVLIGILDL